MKLKFSKVTAFRILHSIGVMILGGIGIYLYGKTLIDWWVPVLVAVTLAVITSSFSPKWQWMTQSDGRIVNYICHVVCVGIFGYALFLSSNYLFSDADSTHTENVMVQQKHIKVNTSRSRRGGRRTTNSYCLELAFENGRVKSISVPKSVYNKIRVGQPREMTLRKGLFGFPIIKKSFQ